MKRLTRTFPLILAAALQVLPLLRNIVSSPMAGSSFAFILRWGIGTVAALESVDAVSGATNYFASASEFTGTVGVPFTNNLALKSSGSDGGAYTVITSNGVSTPLTVKGQTTTFAMPPGLNIQFNDNTKLVNPVYDAIYGTPTTDSTNTFTVSLIYQSQIISTNITIRISAPSASPPVITNHPANLTVVAGGSAAFNVVAGGSGPLFYQWKFNTNTPLPNATNATLTLANIRASQAGTYSVTVTNAAGITNSLQAQLVVTNPPPSAISTPVKNGSLFQFTFIPVVGLTNTVEAGDSFTGGNWSVLTNVPPPADTAPVTVTDPFVSSNRFYRVLVIP